jgi:hypothetical protein
MSCKFMVLTSCRSGSTELIEVLNHIEGIVTCSVLFHVPAMKAGTQTVDSGQSDH